MNRMDRLFAITVLLQSRPRLRAVDLAETFGVSKRTIYRDIVALSESGIPVVALPGEGYTLMEGFTLPPLAFTPAEASALFLGARLLASQAAGRLPAAAEGALAKIAAILPPGARQQVERLTAMIGFITPRARFDLDDPRLALLQQAVLERRVIALRYHGLARDEVTERQVEPHHLTYAGGAWYVDGFCRLRQDGRAFRFDRIEDLVLLDERFTPRTIEPPSPPEPIVVRVRFAGRVARWVRERQHYAFAGEEAAPGGDGVIMTYRLDAAGEMTPWLLSWGAAAEVLAPPALRAALRDEARALADQLA